MTPKDQLASDAPKPSKCVWRWTSHVVPGRGYGQENVPSVRCETHGWEAIGGAPLNDTSSCPIGRIEAATEEALGKIEQKAREIET